MKKLGLLIFIIAYSSCKKHSENTNHHGVPELVLSWDWQRSVTGWGAISTPSPDSLITLSFGDDGKYILQVNSQSILSGNYSTSPDSVTNSYQVIHFDQHFGVDNKFRLMEREAIMTLGSDTLLLYDYLINDGSTHLFVRHHL